MKKEEIVAKYIDLAYKLGKLPSKREADRFGIKDSSVEYHFQSINKLKTLVMEKHPELKRLEVAPKLVTDDVELYRQHLEKAKNSKSNDLLTTNVSTLDYIAKFSQNVFSGRVKPSKTKKTNKKIERVHTLVLSDLHFGADIKGEETGSTDYGVKEEARRFASIIKEAGSYKVQYRNTTSLKLLLLGDIIENSMHDPRTGAVVAEQVCRAIHLLIQGVAYLATKYNKIEVECATGNHDRNTARHQQRAIHQKWDSLSTIIYYAVKEACSKLDNVSFNIPKAPISSYKVFGYRFGYTHGDSVLNPGNPGTSINVRQLEQQVNKFNAALPDKEEYSVVIYGHTHTGHVVYLSNGTILLGNGSLPPADDFATSIGILESANRGQWMFETVKGHPVGDLRYISTGEHYDKDVSLDAIIKPWSDLN